MRTSAALNIFIRPLCGVVFLFLALSSSAVAEKLGTLKVGEDTYENVVVTSVTATDLYFEHSRGIGNVKLKKLSPELQARFHYDPAKSTAAETERARQQASYRQSAEKEAEAARAAERELDINDENLAEVPPHAISAKAFIDQAAPTIGAEKWLNGKPDLNGKFLLVSFWSTQSAASRGNIPRLNKLQHKFQDRLVVIGITDETEAEVRRMTSPEVEFFVAIDPNKRSSTAVGVERVPHAVLVDKQGVVRFEGHPGLLTYKNLETLLTRYAQ